MTQTHATWTGKGFEIVQATWRGKHRTFVKCTESQIPMVQQMLMGTFQQVFFHAIPLVRVSAPHWEREPRGRGRYRPTGIFRYFRTRKPQHKHVACQVWTDAWPRGDHNSGEVR